MRCTKSFLMVMTITMFLLSVIVLTGTAHATNAPQPYKPPETPTIDVTADAPTWVSHTNQDDAFTLNSKWKAVDNRGRVIETGQSYYFDSDLVRPVTAVIDADGHIMWHGYSTSYVDNGIMEAGQRTSHAHATVSGKGKYNGSFQAEFEIVRRMIDNIAETLVEVRMPSNIGEQPYVSVKSIDRKVIFSAGRDYSVSYIRDDAENITAVTVTAITSSRARLIGTVTMPIEQALPAETIDINTCFVAPIPN